jgi:GTPase SAR1 family protein
MTPWIFRSITVTGIAGTLYYSYKGNENAFKQSTEYSVEKVRKEMLCQLVKPEFRLPYFDRSDLRKDVVNLANGKILIIEGASGSGKTTVIRELLYDLSSLNGKRGVLYYSPCRFAKDSDEIFNEIVKRSGGSANQNNGLEIFRKACVESYYSSKGKRSLLIIDDAQNLDYKNEVFRDSMGIFRDLSENAFCDVILVVSNGTILKKARSCSGLNSIRLQYLKWPHIPDEEMEAYIKLNRDQIFAPGTISDEQISRFVKLFDSSFNDLQALKELRNKTIQIDIFMNERLQLRKAHLRSLKKEKFLILKKVYDSKNHRSSLDELENLDLAEDLAMSNFLSCENERFYVFHDRLTLQAMHELVREI